MGILTIFGVVTGPILLLTAALGRAVPPSSLRTDHAVRTPWRSGAVRGATYCVLLAAQLFQHIFATLAPNALGYGANIGSSLLFPLSLTLLLYLYTIQRPATFLRILLLIVGTNVTVVTATCAARRGWLPTAGWEASSALWTREASWAITLGTACTVFVAIVMVLAYRWLVSWVRARWFVVALPLLTALLLDSVLFAGVLSLFREGDSYWRLLAGQWASKWISGTAYASLLTLCLAGVDTEALGRRAMPAGQFLKMMLVTVPLFNISVLIAAVHRATSCWVKEDSDRKESATVVDTTEVAPPAQDRPVGGAADAPEKAVELGLDSAWGSARLSARRRSRSAVARHWNDLIESHLNQWVAFSPEGEQVGVASSFTELWAKLPAATRADVYCQHVVPDKAPLASSQSR